MTTERYGTDNFGFLGAYDRRMERLGRQAESYVHSDPDSCLFKLRLMIETMAKRLLQMQMPHLVSSDLGTMLCALQRSGMLSRRQADDMHAIRRDGNAAVHGEATAPPTAMRRLRSAHRLSEWYAKMIKRGARVQLAEFVAPPARADVNERVRSALRQAETLEDEIETRRRRTREALLLFGYDDDVEAETKRLHDELEALHRVASAAGEPVVDAESVVLVMAMELEGLLEHPRLGLTSREAQREAEKQLDEVKSDLEERERRYAAERARYADATLDESV